MRLLFVNGDWYSGLLHLTVVFVCDLQIWPNRTMRLGEMKELGWESSNLTSMSKRVIPYYLLTNVYWKFFLHILYFIFFHHFSESVLWNMHFWKSLRDKEHVTGERLDISSALFLVCQFPVMREGHQSISYNRKLKLRKGCLYVYTAKSMKEAAEREVWTTTEVFPRGPLSVMDLPPTQISATITKWFDFVLF